MEAALEASILSRPLRCEARRQRIRQLTTRRAAGLLIAAALVVSALYDGPTQAGLASVAGEGGTAGTLPVESSKNRRLRTSEGGPLLDWWRPCAIVGSTCNCVGTLVFGTILGDTVREVNSDGEVQCSAEALGAPSHRDFRICWCQDGITWGDEVRKGLATLIRQGLTPRVEIAADESAGPDCDAASDGLWHGCVTMSRRWDASVIPQVLIRSAPPEEQLDMTLRQLDACHRLAPHASLRVLAVRSGQSADAMQIPVGQSRVCSVVYRPDEGAIWTAKTGALHCATQPGTCTTTPCECRRSQDNKLELHTPQGRRCWACAEAGKEYTFRVNALAEQMEGKGLSWWPPSGINCPPILWFFMDWRAVVDGCPIISAYMVVLFGCLLLRKIEELGGISVWTRSSPLFGPALKRGEVWRFFTYTFFHVQFLDLFHNLLTLIDTLDVEGTPAIVLGDGSNLKCGVGAKQNFMCYPSIGLGSYHTLGVAIISALVGGMTSTWVKFRDVVSGASTMGFGLSGAIVALYALYAGAELDQSTSVQRSFQDWVWLRLIFVGFHIAMEWVRGLSQRDAAGLIAHTASFAAGFAYVLYYLPPMGDGTLLPADRPYIVPCAYDAFSYADSSAPECIRLFSQSYEYRVSDVHQKAQALFAAMVGVTVLNVLVWQRGVPATEAAVVAGLEVSAVLCMPEKPGARTPARSSNLEGKDILVWCEVMGVSGLQPPPDRPELEAFLQVRCSGPADVAASARTKPVAALSQPGAWHQSVFLPVKYASSGSLQLALSEDGPQSAALGTAALSLPQALRFNRRDFSEHWLKLQAVGNGRDLGAARASVQVRFRCLEPADLARLRRRVKEELDEGKVKLEYFEQQLVALEQMQALAVPDSAAGTPAQ